MSRPILVVDGVVRPVDSGTKLGDIRIAYPGSFVRDAEGDHLSDAFVMADGVQYELVRPAVAGMVSPALNAATITAASIDAIALPPPPAHNAITNTTHPHAAPAVTVLNLSSAKPIMPPPAVPAKRVSAMLSPRSAVSPRLFTIPEQPASDTVTGIGFIPTSSNSAVNTAVAGSTGTDTTTARKDTWEDIPPPPPRPADEDESPPPSPPSRVMQDEFWNQTINTMARDSVVSSASDVWVTGGAVAQLGQWQNALLSPRHSVMSATSGMSEPLSPRGDADGSGKTAVNPADDDLSMPSLPAARPKPRLLTQIVRHLKNSPSGDNVHVEYVVKVKDEDTNLVYHVTKRYSEFYALFKQYEKTFGKQKIHDKLPPFPPKKLFGNQDDDLIRERQAGLNEWLSAVLRIPSLYSNTFFQEFVEYKAEMAKFLKAQKKDTAEEKSTDPHKVTLEITKWRETSMNDQERVHVEYQVRVQIGNLSWRIERRFSEFHDLHKEFERMVLTSPDLKERMPVFPPKKIFNQLDPLFVKKRMQELQHWLDSVARVRALTDSAPFKNFIDQSLTGLIAKQVQKAATADA